MESEALCALEVQYNYMEKFMLKSTSFGDAVSRAPSKGEKSAAEIFEHAIAILYTHSFAGVNEVDTEEVEFTYRTELDPREQILDGYSRAIDQFRLLREKFNDRMDDVIHEASGTTRLKAYSSIAMHTIHHMAQGMMLTNINIRSEI